MSYEAAMHTPPAALPRISNFSGDLDRCVATRIFFSTRSTQIVRWRCRHDGDGLRSERHHTAFVITLLQAGSCIVDAGGWSATLDAGTAILHAPGASYFTRHPHGCIDSGWSLAIDAALGWEIVGRAGLPERGWSRYSTTFAVPTGWSGLREVMQLAHLEQSGQPLDPLAVDEAVLGLLAAFAEGSSAATPGCGTETDHRRLVERTIAYLRSHSSETIRLPELSRGVGASPAHLCRVFRRRTRIPIGGYLRRLRLAAALECGFHSHSHLTTVCRREVGPPPSAIRGMRLAVA